MHKNILIIDNDQSFCETIAIDFKRHGYDTCWTTTGSDTIDLLKQEKIDCVLIDPVLENVDGIELCKRIVNACPDIPVIALTALGTMDTAIAAIRAGVFDFINKPVEYYILQIRVDRALKHRSLKKHIHSLANALEKSHGIDTLIGESPTMLQLFEQLIKVATTDMTVLVTGESGTGKELVARAVHTHSNRADGPFIAVSCPALPETLLESELFGHVKGAFTDARQTRRGILHQAHGGTVFLDEIGDLPLSLQPKLLRALETRTARPLGGRVEEPFDARIVTATNQNLEDAVQKQEFREDLFFRINTIKLELPPLREREGDILLLAKYFTDRFSSQMNKEIDGFTEPAAKRLLDHSWPGNVRELRNVIERAVALTRHTSIFVDDLPERIRKYQKQNFAVGGEEIADMLPLAEIGRQYIRYVLEKTDNNKVQAARILGIDRKTLYRKIT